MRPPWYQPLCLGAVAVVSSMRTAPILVTQAPSLMVVEMVVEMVAELGVSDELK